VHESFTGRILCATAFSRHYSSNQTTSITYHLDYPPSSGRQERNFLAIATEDGIYVSLRDNLERSARVLRLPFVAHMTALASHDCLVLIFEKTLLSYPLGPLASMALGQAPSKPLEQTMEMLAPQHKGHVAFFRVGSFGDQDYRTSTPLLHHHHLRAERGIRYSRYNPKRFLSGLWDPWSSPYLHPYAFDHTWGVPTA
jgi:hypothetical protein